MHFKNEHGISEAGAALRLRPWQQRTLLDLEVVLRGGSVGKLAARCAPVLDLAACSHALGRGVVRQAALHGHPLHQAALGAGTALARGPVALLLERCRRLGLAGRSSSSLRHLLQLSIVSGVGIGERQACGALCSSRISVDVRGEAVVWLAAHGAALLQDCAEQA